MKTTKINYFQSKDRIQAKNLFCIRGEMYALSRYYSNNKHIISVDKYIKTTKEWKKLADMNKNRNFYSACSLMNNIFVIGGVYENSRNSCIKYNTKSNSWIEISNTIEGREYAACTVYEGRIVVSGGYNNPVGEALNTVEAYDHEADAWTSMPSMIQTRGFHKKIAFKNKLFVIGGNKLTNEVFDSKNFVVLKRPADKIDSIRPNLIRPTGAFLIENKIFIFKSKRENVVVYDIDKEEWTIKTCQITKELVGLCCVKFPKLKIST